jgi:hypothetical protein
MSNFIAGGLKMSRSLTEPEPDDTVEFLEPEEPGDQIKATLAEASTFYHELLMSDSREVF